MMNVNLNHKWPARWRPEGSARTRPVKRPSIQIEAYANYKTPGKRRGPDLSQEKFKMSIYGIFEEFHSACPVMIE